MYAIQLVALIVSMTFGPWSFATRAICYGFMATMIILDKAILKLDWGELFRFSAYGTSLVTWSTIKSHFYVAPRFIANLLALRLLGLFKPPAVNEQMIWTVIGLCGAVRTVHTVKYLIDYNRSETKACMGVPIKYPRGLYANAIWGLMECVINMFLILHVSVLWMGMYKLGFDALNVPSYDVGGIIGEYLFSWIHEPLFGKIGPTELGDGLIVILLAKTLLIQFSRIVEQVWWEGHEGLHETKGGIYVMFHKQHHLNRTPMPSDSCTEHIVELADIYCWSNFLLVNPYLMTLAWLLITHTGSMSHNSLHLHEEFPAMFLKELRRAEFTGTDEEIKHQLKANHVLHHMHTHCNYSFPTVDKKVGTLRTMTEEDHKAHEGEEKKQE